MHNVAVMALQRDDPAIQTTGLAAAMQKLMREPGHRTDCDELKAMWNGIRIHPDAFKLEKLENDFPQLSIYEIEDTSPITVHKMLGICELWWLMDAMYGDLRVFVFDRYGQNRREIDVREWESIYWRALEESVSATS